VDESVAGLEGGDFSLVVIDADHAVADLGEADSRDQADVTRANDRDLNSFAHGLRQLLPAQCNACSLVDFRQKRKFLAGRSEDQSQTGAIRESIEGTICVFEMRRVE
jgi:hypothetical protein